MKKQKQKTRFLYRKLLTTAIILLACRVASWAQVLTAVTSPMPTLHSITGTASYSQTFVITGNTLGSATAVQVNIGGTPQTNYEFSIDNITFANNLSIPVTAGTMSGSPRTIYVRVKSTAAVGNLAAANVNINLVGAGATNANMSISAQVYPANTNFTAGNIAVLRTGYSSSVANAVLVDEYNPTTNAYVQTFIMPQSSASATGTLTMSGAAGSEGFLSRSADGQFLCIPGYAATIGTVGIATSASATNNRVAALLKFNGTKITNTTFTSHTAGNARSAASIDGSAMYLGGSVTADGLKYLTTGTSGTGTTIASVNIRATSIQNGQLYFSVSGGQNSFTGSPMTGITVPNAAATSTSMLTGLANNYTALLLDIDPNIPGNDLMYVNDQTNGILKYSSADGINWTARGSITGAAYSVAGFYTGSAVQLYYVIGTASANTLYKYTDATTSATSISGVAATVGTSIATAFTNTGFRGIALAPVALPTTPNTAVATSTATASNILLGSSNNVIYRLDLTSNTANAIVTGLTLTTSGTYATTDFNATGFKLWFSSSNTFDATAIPLATLAPVTSGSTISINNIAQTIPASSTRYIYFTADVNAGATIGNTINITATPLGNITLASSGTKSGSAPIGGVKTIFPAPSLSTSGTITNMFTYSGTASGAQTFTLSGNYLAGNVTVTAPNANFQVSNDGITYGSSFNITPVSQSIALANQTVYVRLSASAAVGAYSGNITCASSGAVSQLVAITGTVATAGVAFTPGNIVLHRVGNGAALGSAATDTYIDEYTPVASGTLVQSIAIPTGINGDNRILTNSGSATSESNMNLSVDGQYLTLAGYDAAVGTTAIAGTASATTNRIVGTVKYDGTVNTTTRIPDGFSGNNPRSVASIDGNGFFVAGAPNTFPADGGLRYATLGSNSSISLSPAPSNARIVNIFDNQLFLGGASSPNVGLNKVTLNGSGVSTSTGQVVTNLGLPGGPTDPYSFVLLDRDATVTGLDVAYVANNAGGLSKYSFDGTTWTARGTLLGTVSAITGKVNGANVDLYVCVGNSTTTTVYKITDAAAFNANITGSGGAVSGVAGAVNIKTSPTNTVWRGITFAPQSIGGTPSVTLSSGGPAAGDVLQASQNNVIYQLNASVTTAKAVLTNITLTTAGSYVTSDLVANSFKLYYSSDNTFDATDILIATNPIVASGNNISFDIAQVIQAGSTGVFFVTTDITGAATINNNINITATALSNITFANGATKSGTIAAGGLQNIISSTIPTIFYSNGGNLDNIANWGDQTNGTLSSVLYTPTFSSTGFTFRISNGSNTITGNWNVSGANTKVVVSSSETFNIPSGFALTTTSGASVDVEATGTLNLFNGTIPTLGVLDPASNVSFQSVSPTTQTIPGSLTTNYGNLTITGSGTKIIGGAAFNSEPIEVYGDLVINGATLNRTLGTEQIIGFRGNITLSNTVSFTAGYNSNVSLEPKGTANQTITSNGQAINCYRFYYNVNTNSSFNSNKPSGSLTLDNAGGGTNLVVKDNIKLNCGGTSPANSATIDDNGQTITVANNVQMTGNAANYNYTGTLLLNGSSSQILQKDGNLNQNVAIVPTINNLSIQQTGTSIVDVRPNTGAGILNIAGNFAVAGTSTGKFTPNGNTIKIGGNYNNTRTIDMIAAGTSTFEFNGSLAQTLSTLYTGGESFNNVKINNASGLTQIAGDIKITGTGNLNCTAGILSTGSNKVVLNNTASITETISSNVIGNVETVRTLTNAIEYFGGLGLQITAAGAQPGVTTLLRNTGTSISAGCNSNSIKRIYTLTPTVNAGLNATVSFGYLPSVAELNGIPETSLGLYSGGGPWTLISNLAQLNTVTNKITVTGVNSFDAFIATSGTPNASAGGSVSRCGAGNTTVSGATSTFGTILWTHDGNGSISAANSLTPTYTAVAGDAGNTVTLTLTASNPPCADATATYTINVSAIPTAIAGGSQIICETGTATVPSATVTNGSITWSHDGAGSFAGSPTSSLLLPTYTAAAGDAGNTVTLTLTVSNAPCANAVATHQIVVKASPIASAGGSATICQNGSHTVVGATSSNGTRLWTHNGAGSFSGGNATSTLLLPTYIANASDAGNTVTLTLTQSNPPCADATATYSIVVNADPTASAGGSAISCETGAVTVTGASSSNGTVNWVHDGTGSLTNANTLTPTYNCAAGDAGQLVTLTLQVTGNAPCGMATAQYTINVRPRPTVNPVSVNICNGSPVGTMSIVAPEAATDYKWSPANDLYTDALLTTPYVLNTPSNVVYTAPFTSTSYNVIATNTVTGCTTAATSVNVIVCPAATNDICQANAVAAIPVTTTATFTQYSLTGATPSIFASCAPISRDIWYRAIVPSNGEINLVTAPGNNANANLNILSSVVSIFTATNCSTAVTLAGVSACNSNGAAGNMSYARANGLTPGSTVYIRIASATTGNPVAAQFLRMAVTSGLVWTAAADDNFNNPANWHGGDASAITVPDATISAIIPHTVTKPKLYSISNVKGMNFTCGTPYFISPGINLNGFTLNVKGDWLVGPSVTSTLTLDCNGTVVFNGTGATAQTIGGKNTFGNLSTNNTTAGVTLTGNTGVSCLLNTTAGNLNSAGFLTLRSTATTTALVNPLAGNITGNVNVERKIGAISGYHYLSSPVSGAFVNNTSSGWRDDFTILSSVDGLQFVPGNIYNVLPTVFEYDETNLNPNSAYGFSGATGTTDAITPLKGFACVVPANTTVDVFGPVNNGPINYNVTKASDGINLIGNPYPSPINWTSFRSHNTNLSTIYKSFVSTGGYNGSYGEYNSATSLGTNGVGNIIASSQGFMVEANTAGPIQAINTDRTTDLNPIFFSQSAVVNDLLRLELVKDNRRDEILIFFAPSMSTDNFDALTDAKKLFPFNTEHSFVYSIAGNDKLAMNGLGEFNIDKMIPLGILVSAAGNHQLVATDLSSFAPSAMVYLFDSETGTVQNLRSNPSYSFNLPAGTNEGRFFIQFTPAVQLAVLAATCVGNGNDGKINLTYNSTSTINVSIKNEIGNVIAAIANFNGQQTINNLTAGNYEITYTYANGYESVDYFTVSAVNPVNMQATVSTSTAAIGENINFSSVNSTGSAHWNFGDGLTAMGNDVNHIYNANGNYIVTATASNGECEQMIEIPVNISSATGIESVSNQSTQWLIANNQITVKFSDVISENTSIELFDLAGKLIYSNTISKGQMQHNIPTSKFAEGIYVAKLNLNNINIVKKVALRK